MGTATTASTGCTPFDVRRRVVKRKRAENVIRRRPSGCLVLPRPSRANSGQAEPSPESVRFGKCEIKILDKVAQAEGDDKRNGNGNVPFFTGRRFRNIYFCVIDIAACFEYSQRCCYLARSTFLSLPLSLASPEPVSE